jgi:pimeloyl-ACP methyl ester carboxylesterase
MMMNRRVFSTTLLAGAAASLISTRGMAANATAEKARNVVLVHGLFADGSSWSEVIPRLQAAGLNVTSVQNPLTTLPEAVASAESVLARQDGPTVLVGHSFSGMIVTEAGVHPNVSALVYVAARAPDAGEDYAALAKTYPTPPASAGIVFDGDQGRLSEEAFLRDFAGDLPEAKAKVLYAVQEPFHKALLTGKTTHAAWRSKPSYYAVSTEDRTINPDLERFMAKRMGAQTIEVKASHLSLISHPEEITRLILKAAGKQPDAGKAWGDQSGRPQARRTRSTRSKRQHGAQYRNASELASVNCERKTGTLARRRHTTERTEAWKKLDVKDMLTKGFRGKIGRHIETVAANSGSIR